MTDKQLKLLAKLIASSIIQSLRNKVSQLNPSYYASPLSVNYCAWCCNQIIENFDNWDSGKSHRWVGWIQGTLGAIGLTTIDFERERVINCKKLCLDLTHDNETNKL